MKSKYMQGTNLKEKIYKEVIRKIKKEKYKDLRELSNQYESGVIDK